MNTKPVDLSSEKELKRLNDDEANRRIREKWVQVQSEVHQKKVEVSPTPFVPLSEGQPTFPLSEIRCQSCMWFVEKVGGVHKLGRCRRHAPTMNGFPAVFPADWCGDHKLDELKITK